VIEEVQARLKQKRSFDRAELSRLKSAVLRALAKAKGAADPKLRHELETKLERLFKILGKRSPKRGPSAVALDEVTTLVSRLITNRNQANRLIEHLRRLCD
jgi:hypothetical protein